MAADRFYRRWSLAVAVCAGLLLTSCASSVNGAAGASSGSSAGAAAGASALSATTRPSPAGGTTAPALPECTNGTLPTVTPGTITIGTESPGRSPWYQGDPRSAQGLEPAVGYAIAQVLGFDHDHVTWTVVDRTQATAGTATAFDVDLNQFTAPDAGTATADYSTGYFAVTDTLVTRQGDAAAPNSTATLTGARLGTVSGTSSTAGVNRVSGTAPSSFVGPQQALDALATGAVAGVVLPTPDALAAAQADATLSLAGQLPSDPQLQPDQFKVLLPKGSALTGCVSAAVDRLRVEGTLQQLAGQWIDSQVPPLR